MQSLILYTKKFELNFNGNVAEVDVTSLLDELSKDYVILDPNPIITIADNFQYITLKLGKKSERQKIGF